jgi:hypothetical protein
MRCLFWTLLFVPLLIQGQSRIDHWCIGDSIHLRWIESNFEFQDKVPFSSFEGGAGISDTAGILLFYTDGRTVWDGNHEVVPGGSGLSDSVFHPYGSSVAQSAMFLPGFDSLGLTYYVFTRETSIGGTGKAYCSTIRLNAATGAASIDSSERLIPVFDSLYSEAMTAVRHANGRDWWVVVSHSDIVGDKQWVGCRLLSPQGFSSESIFILDSNYTHKPHVNLTVNYQGDLIGFAALEYLYILDFDRCDGLFNLRKKITEYGDGFAWYSLEFSEDSKYMYACDYFRKDIWQINTSTGALEYKLPTIGGPYPFVFGQIRRAPDNSIYIAYGSTSSISTGEPRSQYLGRIPYPDAAGAASGMDTFAVYLGGRYSSLALPNHPHYELGALEGSPCDTLSVQVVDTTLSGGGDYSEAHVQWSVYPNPASSVLTVEHPMHGDLVLLDLQGRLVRQWTLEVSPSFLSLTGLPDGLYGAFLQDRAGRLRFRTLLLVQH